ncbi:hypothetical protein EYR40_009136 [Pleurotus pulmonarius]|nr:hypothetical protein EYR40_009136 [Pleurotus pulmonarius]
MQFEKWSQRMAKHGQHPEMSVDASSELERAHIDLPRARLCDDHEAFSLQARLTIYTSTLRMTDSSPPKALLLPEILKKIFELLEDGCNALNARVCKDWSDEALSVIWDDVDAKNLFSLLAPLGVDSPIGFTRELEEEDWDVFERYSPKVHILRFTGQYDISLFKDLGHGRRRLELLPNLCELRSPPPTPLLAGPSVQKLVLRDFNEQLVIAWLAIISRRMCHIKALSIERGINPPSDQLISTLMSTLRNMEASQALEVPMSHINDDTFHVFASLPNLRSLRASDMYTVRQKHITPQSLTFNWFPSHPFPSLVELRVEMDFPAATILLPQLDACRTLRYLGVFSWCDESPTNCSSFLEAIQKACPALQRLELARTTIRGTIQFATLDGLRGFQNLTTLTLHGFIPGPDHALELPPLLGALVGLESLTLCYPFDSPSLAHPPSSLATIASVLRNLRWLCIRIDTQSAMPAAKFPAPFLKLRKLQLGASEVSEPAEVAMYLSRLLPPSCDLGVPIRLVGEKKAKWDIVKTWVPILVQARVEARLKGRIESERALALASATE